MVSPSWPCSASATGAREYWKTSIVLPPFFPWHWGQHGVLLVTVPPCHGGAFQLFVGQSDCNLSGPTHLWRSANPHAQLVVEYLSDRKDEKLSRNGRARMGRFGNFSQTLKLFCGLIPFLK